MENIKIEKVELKGNLVNKIALNNFDRPQEPQKEFKKIITNEDTFPSEVAETFYEN